MLTASQFHTGQLRRAHPCWGARWKPPRPVKPCRADTVSWKSAKFIIQRWAAVKEAETDIPSNYLPFRNHHTVWFSTCEGHLIGHPVNRQHSLSPIITGLNEKLLWGCVPERTKRTVRASPMTLKVSLKVSHVWCWRWKHTGNSGELNIYTAAIMPLFESRGIVIQINKAVKNKKSCSKQKFR